MRSKKTWTLLKRKFGEESKNPKVFEREEEALYLVIEEMRERSLKGKTVWESSWKCV